MSKNKFQLWNRISVATLLFVFGLFLLLTGVFSFTRGHNARVEAATSTSLNMQARLYSSSGNIVPDGYYNVEFTLYDALSGGSELWDETWYDSNGASAGQDNRVRVVNGYMSVPLGSLDAFPALNWDQDMWVTINVGGTTQTATPTWDGEMSPRIKLTSVPFAQAARNVYSSHTNSASTNSGNVSISTGNATGSTSNSGNISIDVGTATQTAGTISIGTANASGITIGRTGVTTTNSGAMTVSQLFTGSLGANISGGTINLNASSNNATNINTGSSTGAVSIGNSSAGAIALNSGAAITADTTAGISLDAATASNLTVTGSGQSLTLAAAGGGAQQVIMQSAGTGANALRLQASDTAGGIDIDSGTNGITLDSTGAISLDSTALTSNFNITANSASNATLTIGVSNAGAGNGILTLAADETINLNAPTIVGSATTLNLFNTTATTINVGGAVGSGGINFAGGSGSTGCTIDGSNGNLTCTGSVSGASGGTTVVDEGNSGVGTLTVGTNESEDLAFETNSTTRWLIDDDNGHLIPNLDDTYDIGDNTHRVRDLFTGPGTIHVGTSTSDEGTISYNTTSNNLLFGATNGSLFQNGANSTTAFQIQNSAGTSNLFIADTTNTRIGIGVASPQYTLDVAGDVNVTGKVKEDGFDLVPAATISTYAGSSAPSGWLMADGSCVSQTTYAALYTVVGSTYAVDGCSGGDFELPDLRGRSAIGSGQGKYTEAFPNTDINTGNDEITVASNSSLYTGQAVLYDHLTGTIPTGLTDNTTYYIIRMTSTTVRFATSLANAQAGTDVDITAATTSTNSMQISYTNRSVGAIGGEESHSLTLSELASHDHNYNDPGHSHTLSLNAFTSAFNVQAGSNTCCRVSSPFGGIANTAYTGITHNANGSNTPFNSMSPYVVLAYIIKY